MDAESKLDLAKGFITLLAEESILVDAALSYDDAVSLLVAGLTGYAHMPVENNLIGLLSSAGHINDENAALDHWVWYCEGEGIVSEEYTPTVCPMCDGPGDSIGTLGRLFWFRCINCGWDFSAEYTPEYAGEENDDERYQ